MDHSHSNNRPKTIVYVCAQDCQTHNLHRYNCNNYLLHAGLMGLLFLEEDDNFFDKMDTYIEKLIAIAPDIFPLSKEYKFLQVYHSR